MKNFASPGKCTDSGFKFLCLLLFNKILQMSLRRFNLIMTWKPLECKQWQSSTKEGSIGTSISSKISKIFDSRPLLAMLAGILEISKHSLLEYCSLAPFFHCHESFRQLKIYVSGDFYISLEFSKVWL